MKDDASPKRAPCASVLAIGGAGFLGRHVTGALLSRGHRVAVLSRRPEASVAGAELLVADRRDPRALTRALDGRRFDFTIDLAAYDAADVELLLNAPRASLGPYVLISTGQVYLVTESTRVPYPEDESAARIENEPAAGSDDHRQWRYGIGKRRAEAALLAFRSSHGVRGAILRLPVLVGEADRSLRLWAYLERMLDGGPLLLPEGGRSATRFLDPHDVAAALLRILQGETPRHAVYNLAQPQILTLKETLECAAAAAGVEPRFVDASWDEIDRAGIDRAFSPYAGPWVSVLDPTRAALELGFAGTPLRDYLPRVVRWHLENRPEKSHPGYSERAREIELATRLGAAAA